MEQYWKAYSDRPSREKIHIELESKGLTVCGFNIAEKEMTRIPKSTANLGKIKMCSRCMRVIKAKDPEKASYYPKETKKDSSRDFKIEKRDRDEVANPKLKKFKSIINSAKEKQIAIKGAIESALEDDECPAIDQLKEMLRDIYQITQKAIAEANFDWEKDQNKFNDTRHFHIITSLRNFSQAIESIQEI
jgi:hypothetical protein